MPRILPFALCLLLISGKLVADDGQWLMHYYNDPKPDDIASRLTALQKEGLLSKQDSLGFVLGFLSRIMKDNPEKVVPWLQLAESFPPSDRIVIRTAAFYSNTPKAHDYFTQQKIAEFAGKPSPDISALPVNHPSILDFYWGAYFASGDPLAIRRIVSALEFQKDSGATEKYKTSKQSEADKQAALNDAIYQSAMWSLTSNSKQDEKIFVICKNLLAPDKLTTTERTFLAVALSKAKPDQVKVEIHDGKIKVDIVKPPQ